MMTQPTPDTGRRLSRIEDKIDGLVRDDRQTSVQLAQLSAVVQAHQANVQSLLTDHAARLKSLEDAHAKTRQDLDKKSAYAFGALAVLAVAWEGIKAFGSTILARFGG